MTTVRPNKSSPSTQFVLDGMGSDLALLIKKGQERETPYVVPTRWGGRFTKPFSPGSGLFGKDRPNTAIND